MAFTKSPSPVGGYGAMPNALGLDDDAVGTAGRSRGRGCRFCADTSARIDYKDVPLLRQFVTERGKLVPRRITGLCATHQREAARAISRARMIALMPYTAIGG